MAENTASVFGSHVPASGILTGSNKANAHHIGSLNDGNNSTAIKRSELLRAEHERAMALLSKEKAAAAALAAAAQDKGRKVEAALQAVAMAQDDLDKQAQEQEEKVWGVLRLERASAHRHCMQPSPCPDAPHVDSGWPSADMPE